MKSLPVLTSEPAQYPECCCTISTTLIVTLAHMLPLEPSMVVSVGCGTGLLEAILLGHIPGLNLRGVEVKNAVVRYLSEETFDIVNGAWDLYHPAFSAAAWMFIYPREATLIEQYYHRIRDNGTLKLVIWIGPRADHPKYEKIFESPWTKSVHEDCGLSTYESMIVWTRETRSKGKAS